MTETPNELKGPRAGEMRAITQADLTEYVRRKNGEQLASFQDVGTIPKDGSLALGRDSLGSNDVSRGESVRFSLSADKSRCMVQNKGNHNFEIHEPGKPTKKLVNGSEPYLLTGQEEIHIGVTIKAVLKVDLIDSQFHVFAKTVAVE